jgi:hypothetical protein
MLFALVLSVPLAARLPTIRPRPWGRSCVSGTAGLVLGAERLLLGSQAPHFVRLAQVAVAAFVTGLVVAVGSYAFLYQRFDRVILRPADAPTGPRRQRPRFLPRLDERRTAFAAISHFRCATLACTRCIRAFSSWSLPAERAWS